MLKSATDATAAALPATDGTTEAIAPAPVLEAAAIFERVGSGEQAGTSFDVGLAVDNVFDSIDTPVRYRSGNGAPVADANISAAEHLLLERGDLRGFWLSRIHKDPVARLGLAMWGNPGDLRRAIDASQRWGEMGRWQPDLNVASRVMLEFMAPDGVPMKPTNARELSQYWQWLGDAAMDKLRDALLDHGSTAPLRDIGRTMAGEHVAQIEHDGMCTNPVGHEPGLLSAKQVTEYHRRVFESFGLPPATFGGTMFDFMVDTQLAIGAGSWLPGADQNDPR